MRCNSYSGDAPFFPCTLLRQRISSKIIPRDDKMVEESHIESVCSSMQHRKINAWVVCREVNVGRHWKINFIKCRDLGELQSKWKMEYSKKLVFGILFWGRRIILQRMKTYERDSQHCREGCCPRTWNQWHGVWITCYPQISSSLNLFGNIKSTPVWRKLWQQHVVQDPDVLGVSYSA